MTTSPTFLLDANVLIALVTEEHEHHAVVTDWIANVRRIALCPVGEGALVRFLVRLGESAELALRALRAMYADPRCDFWPDSASYVDADLGRVTGHRQVTDGYLVALVASHDNARLATLDQPLWRAYPELAELVARA